jgi:hypothetical protein
MPKRNTENLSKFVDIDLRPNVMKSKGEQNKSTGLKFAVINSTPPNYLPPINSHRNLQTNSQDSAGQEGSHIKAKANYSKFRK